MRIDFDIVKIIKKNSAMVLPAGIAAAAIFVFVPTWMLSSGINTAMQESTSLGSQVRQLSANAVSAQQYLKEQDYQAEHEKDANSVAQMALQTSMRELLVYDIFPDTNETSSVLFTNFGKVYRSAIDGLANSMNGRDCPTDGEVQELTRNAGINRDTAYSGSGSDKIFEQVCQDRASKISVYTNPESFASYGFWNEYAYQGKAKAVQDCWKSQLAYWIQKDIADSIIVMNKGSNSIATSPVKRLLTISFISEYKESSVSTANVSPGTSDMPSYVGDATGTANSDSSAMVNSVLGPAWTGRVSNDEIDVVHFACSFVVSARSVLPLMQQLCSSKEHSFKGWDGQGPEKVYQHNQITILKSDVEPVVQAAANQMGDQSNKYKYGEDAVVQLNVVCEYVFNKAGYDAVKPKPPTDQPTQ